jgi:hypothetical protein
MEITAMRTSGRAIQISGEVSPPSLNIAIVGREWRELVRNGDRTARMS